MVHRVYNFNPGPATLPLEVLEKVQHELLDYKGTGMSVMEISHRSPEFDEINEKAIALTRELFGLGTNYHVLFVGGGASTQFACIPMNFLSEGQTAAYVDTGSWSSKAIKEAKLFGNVHVAGSSKEANYNHIPKEIEVPTNAQYVHLTSNNTIFGTQYQSFPEVGNIPLVCDMSSDIASRKLDFTKFSMIYAGAQKNMGPSGVTMVIIRDDLLAKCKDGIPTMFNYKTHAEKKSLFNTPPSFSIYIVKLILEWLKNMGGLEKMEKRNMAKKERIYQLMDLHPDYFKGTAEKDSRSWMNLTMRLPNEELEKKFIAESKAAGFVGLKGHRSVGGIRVSLYNAMSLEGADRLAEFALDFKKKN